MKRAICWVALVAMCVNAAEITGTGHRMLAKDDGKKNLLVVDAKGEIEWEFPAGPIHDMQVLPNGNYLVHTNYQNIVEVTPDKEKKVVWKYDASKQNRKEGERVEVHAFQRLADGNTMIVESNPSRTIEEDKDGKKVKKTEMGPARIIEVDKDGKIVKEVVLTVKNKSGHGATRNARKLENGHYLVAHESDGTIREYDEAGKVIWDFAIPLFDKKPSGDHGPNGWGNGCYSVLRLPNGNTLFTTGNGHAVMEVNPAKEIVWHLKQDDLPGIKLAWVTNLQVLKNGNIVLGNCHAGPENPQVIEVTKDKKVVWSFKDFKNFGNALPVSLVLDEKEVLR